MKDRVLSPQTLIRTLMGIALALSPLCARADGLRAIMHQINNPGVQTDGQIWLEEEASEFPIKKCGEPDTGLQNKLLRQINAVVSTDDGQAVRMALGRCEDQLHMCLTVTSDRSVEGFQEWTLRTLMKGKSAKKEVAIELSGARYFLHDVSPAGMSILEYPKSTTRIYEYKIGSIEAFKN